VSKRPIHDSTSGGESAKTLEAARAAYAGRNWADAYDLFAAADAIAPVEADDLERLATAAYLVGRDERSLSAFERAYQSNIDTRPARAARCAFWLGLTLLFAGKAARGNGWLARAQRLVDSEPNMEAEAGYLLLPEIEGKLGAGDWEAAQALSKRAVDIGNELDEPDLRACALHLHGRALLGACQVDDAFASLDQAMLDVTGGVLSPIMGGLIYCSVIDACQQVYAVARAREWTDALADWCNHQPQMVAFSGTCLVHRAEVMQLEGRWPDAIDEARRACERPSPAGAAFYQRAEVHRLRGEHDLAEQAYREASQRGFEPQPGLALLRLAQGNEDVACGSIRRVVRACDAALARARLLPAFVEIMLAAGDTNAAREASRALAEIADQLETDVLQAMAAGAEAAVSLAEGNAEAALGPARKAFETWRRVDAPYEAARARILVALACRELRDDEGAQLDFDAAATMLAQLGAAPELARLERLRSGAGSKPRAAHGLTPRELEVLRHVAAGKTNKAIAAELFVSDKTVDRHLSNIFNKLDVSSRTAAAAYAYEHKLV